jgi:hypothetical protein
MRVTAGLVILAGLSGLSTAAFADEVINFPSCAAFSAEYLHGLAKFALQKRRYGIEEDTPTTLVGEQDKLKVEMIVEPSHLVIRWKDGFGSEKKNNWLRNLKTDVLWRMAE